MRINLVRKYLFLICLPLTVVACGSMVEFEDMTDSLNARIGKPAPNTAVGNASFYKYRDVDRETFELTWTRTDECSYALVIRKTDSTIIAWHFLKNPPPTGCKFQNVHQLM